MEHTICERSPESRFHAGIRIFLAFVLDSIVDNGDQLQNTPNPQDLSVCGLLKERHATRELLIFVV